VNGFTRVCSRRFIIMALLRGSRNRFPRLGKKRERRDAGSRVEIDTRIRTLGYRQLYLLSVSSRGRAVLRAVHKAACTFDLHNFAARLFMAVHKSLLCNATEMHGYTCTRARALGAV